MRGVAYALPRAILAGLGSRLSPWLEWRFALSLFDWKADVALTAAVPEEREVLIPLFVTLNLFQGPSSRIAASTKWMLKSLNVFQGQHDGVVE